MSFFFKLAKTASKINIPTPLKTKLLALLVKTNNALVDMKKSSKAPSTGLQELDEVIIRSRERTVINDHLPLLFIESLCSNPKLIVELGVETGQSTFALERVARLCKSKLVSVDLEDCSNVCQWEDWIFVKKDDLEFSRMFTGWCKENDIIPEIDILFIDTDHHYEQTIKEIRQWFPYLGKKAKAFFHDSNVKPVYRRKDGSLGTAPDYQRGVTRALEEYLKNSLNEEEDFVAFRNGWLIKHWANCNGFTMLEKIKAFVDR